MSEGLPRGWASAQLSALGDWLGGGTPSKAVREYWESGTIHWVSPKDMKRPLIDSAQDQITVKAVKESTTNLIPPDSVLMVIRSGILEHSFPVAVNTIPVAINQDLKAWTPWEGIDPTYTAYFLKSCAQRILETCSKDGTTVSSIDFDRLSVYDLAVAPRAEQARIVSKVDELFSRIEKGEGALERVQKLVDRYRQSMLKAAVKGELTREWREQRNSQLESGEALLRRILKARREVWEKSQLDKMKAKAAMPANDKWKEKYQEPSPPDTTDLPELPEGWAWASVEQLCSEFGNGLSRKPADKPPGLPILRISAVRPMSVDGSDIRYYVPDAGESLESVRVRFGDLLFTRYNGSKELVGVSGVFSGVDPVLHPDKLIRARVASARYIIPEFLALSLNCGESWRHISGRVKTSAGQHGIAGSDIKRAPVPLPPAAEQRRIVDAVEIAASKCVQVAATCAGQLRRSWALRQATLRSAFAGQLVPHDPTDEPTSILLKRIAAERAAGITARKRNAKR